MTSRSIIIIVSYAPGAGKRQFENRSRTYTGTKGLGNSIVPRASEIISSVNRRVTATRSSPRPFGPWIAPNAQNGGAVAGYNGERKVRNIRVKETSSESGWTARS